MANAHISKRLQDARKAAGLTQKDVYQWLGIGQSTFSAWETGLGEPSVEVFLRLCQKYEIGDIAAFFLPDPGTGLTREELDPVFIKKMLALPKRSQDAVRNCLEFEYNNSPVRGLHTFRRMRRILLYTQATTAGRGNYLDDQDAEIRELEAPDEATFALHISGDSMEPLIHDGDIVFVHQQTELEPGEIGIFTYNGESFCKMWDNRAGMAKLVSMNKAYAPILLNASDTLTIHGKVLL